MCVHDHECTCMSKWACTGAHTSVRARGLPPQVSFLECHPPWFPFKIFIYITLNYGNIGIICACEYSGCGVRFPRRWCCRQLWLIWPGCWELNTGLLQEPRVLLTTKSSLQHPLSFEQGLSLAWNSLTSISQSASEPQKYSSLHMVSLGWQASSLS